MNSSEISAGVSLFFVFRIKGLSRNQTFFIRKERCQNIGIDNCRT